MLDFLLRFPIFFEYSELKKKQDAALRILHGFTDSVIEKRRRELSTLKINNNDDGSQKIETKENEEIGIKRKLAFLDSLLQLKVNDKPLTNLEIREEVDTFMFEGHDTTTSGITFCLYNLAKYPEAQKKCAAEILEVFGKDLNEPTTMAKLNELTYLELVIKESLRLFPSVPLIARKATEDIQLSKST